MRCEESGKGFESGLVSRNREQKSRGIKKRNIEVGKTRSKK